MTRIFLQFLIAVTFALASAAAWAQQTLQTMPFGPPIGNEAARKIGAAAAAETRKNGWRVCIAVVDYHGELVYFERLDNTQLGAVGVAIPIQGGLPIMVDGKFVGAIGVSGVASHQDEQVAAAGLAALK